MKFYVELKESNDNLNTSWRLHAELKGPPAATQPCSPPKRLSWLTNLRAPRRCPTTSSPWWTLLRHRSTTFLHSQWLYSFLMHRQLDGPSFRISSCSRPTAARTPCMVEQVRVVLCYAAEPQQWEGVVRFLPHDRRHPTMVHAPQQRRMYPPGVSSLAWWNRDPDLYCGQLPWESGNPTWYIAKEVGETRGPETLIHQARKETPYWDALHLTETHVPLLGTSRRIIRGVPHPPVVRNISLDNSLHMFGYGKGPSFAIVCQKLQLKVMRDHKAMSAWGSIGATNRRQQTAHKTISNLVYFLPCFPFHRADSCTENGKVSWEYNMYLLNTRSITL
jgi:hypothetical protein